MRHALTLIVTLCLSTVQLTAERTPGTIGAALEGWVVDISGGVLPGATITIRRVSTGLRIEVTTEPDGTFIVRGLPPGTYEVAATRAGFSTSITEVTLAASDVSVHLQIAPGGLAEEVTVFGTRLVGSEDMLRRVPGSFSVLTAETLASSHVFTTSEALRTLPGVSVRDEEGLGLRPNISVRGLSPTRSTKVLLLEDGVPTTYAPYGDNASYYHPPVERFSRIEVLKGSGQIAHGPVTVGGVINYITPEPPAHPSLAMTFTGGNREYVNADVSVGGTLGRTGVFVNALHKAGQGARDNVRTHLDDVLLKVARPLGGTQNIDLKLNYYGEASQVTYSGLREDEYLADPRQNPFLNDAFDGDRFGLSGAYRALLGSHVAFTSTVYASRFGRDWWRQSSNSAQRPNDSADPSCGSMANLSLACGNEGRLRSYSLAGIEPRIRVSSAWFGVAHETDAGLRFHVERQNRRQENGDTPIARTGRLVEDNRRTTDALSGFIQHRVLAGRWSVTPGLRVERVGYTRENRLIGVSGATALTEAIPGIGVSFVPAFDTTLFAGVHRGFAPPRAEDIINNTTGGAVDLDPERSWSYEVGARTGFRPGLRVDGAFFRLDYSNQVVPASLAGGVGAALTNGGETLHQGVELGTTFDAQTLLGWTHNAYARLAFTWTPTAEFTGVRLSNIAGSSHVSVSGNRLPYAPETLSTLTIGYQHPAGLDVQIEAQHVGRQFSDDLNTRAGTADGQRGLIPAYTYWNAAATWRVVGRAALFATVKNLFDRTFIVDRSRGILPSHPRLVQVGTTWRF